MMWNSVVVLLLISSNIIVEINFKETRKNRTQLNMGHMEGTTLTQFWILPKTIL